MKTFTKHIFVLAILISSSVYAQTKVKENKVIGTWKLHLNLKEKVNEEMKDENILTRSLMKGFMSTIDDLVQEAEITFEFKKNHTLEVTQKNLDDDNKEITSKTYTWKIDDKGRLVTDQAKGEKFKFNNNTGWMFKNKKLVPVDDKENIESNVWMEKVKK